jgi:hypothetical protein
MNNDADKRNLTAEGLLQKLKDLDITYFFGKVMLG